VVAGLCCQATTISSLLEAFLLAQTEQNHAADSIQRSLAKLTISSPALLFQGNNNNRDYWENLVLALFYAKVIL
jgi:hypothetical protein